mmetsp:Transcript_46295/g.110174  ORF Transcript_46295/g.110174 Transcript_46295/m.110174 type:complete len:1003 (+) Transcript_46295:104-3112(+)
MVRNQGNSSAAAQFDDDDGMLARGASMPAMRKALMLTTPRRRGREKSHRPGSRDAKMSLSESMPTLAPVHDPTDPGPMTDLDDRIAKLRNELARQTRVAQEYLQKQNAKIETALHRIEDESANGSKAHRDLRRRLLAVELQVRNTSGLQLTNEAPAILGSSAARPRSSASAPTPSASSSMPKLPPATSPNRGSEYQVNWMALTPPPPLTLEDNPQTATTSGEAGPAAQQGADVPGSPGAGTANKEDVLHTTAMTVTKLRRRLHASACELQETRQQLERTTTELRLTRNEVDELRLKHSNLERIDKTKSAELLDERRKNDELSKQVKEMSENLLSVMTGNVNGEGGGGEKKNKQGEVSGLRQRCFKLVQQNTALQVQARLLRRQKGWAEAKSRVLQDEVTQVYLGEHDRVKGSPELELAYDSEFKSGGPPESIHIYKPVTPLTYTHKEAVIDFLTHITHTQGSDVMGFLQSSRVYSESIRQECLNGLGREFHALWYRHRQIPAILRAVERIVHLKEHLAAFESFSAEIESLLACGHARLWVVDNLRQCMWTQVREGEGTRTKTVGLPKGREDKDLEGAGFVAAAYALQKPVNVIDARDDSRGSTESDVTPDGKAKTVLCVPVVKGSRVRVVLQAINKLQEPQFNMDTDMRVLRPLGKVAMEVLQVCEATSASSMNSKRNHDLLQLLKDFIPMTSGGAVLMMLERGLSELFSSNLSVLHLVLGANEYGHGADKTVKVVFDKQHRRIAALKTDGLKGLVGFVVKRMNPLSVSWAEINESGNTPYDEDIDLPVAEQTIIHTLPMWEGIGCVAVCQFISPQRERGVMSDDGAYHPENTSHFRLITLLLTIIQKHLTVLMEDPDVRQYTGKEKPKEASQGSEDGSDDDLDQKEDAVKLTASQKRRQSQLEMAYTEKAHNAAVVIQKLQRAKAARKKTMELRNIADTEPGPAPPRTPSKEGKDGKPRSSAGSGGKRRGDNLQAQPPGSNQGRRKSRVNLLSDSGTMGGR